MSNLIKNSESNDREIRLLARVKEIIDQPLSSKDKLIEDIGKIIEEHEGSPGDEGESSRSTYQPQSEKSTPQNQPEKILEMKNRLLTHITHEFLTPLNLIITPLEQMLPQCKNPEHKQLMAMMYRNSQRLLLVITQILELLKLESRKLKLKVGQQNIVSF